MIYIQKIDFSCCCLLHAFSRCLAIGLIYCGVSLSSEFLGFFVCFSGICIALSVNKIDSMPFLCLSQFHDQEQVP